ncbi:MAG: glycine cleavage system protein GcvH [Clostridia bacterium]|nr:glycine cleavage system protein GcvH [Clostridia bacterium]
MTNPRDLKYTKEHEWARIEGNRVTVGITHYAQEALGDVVFVELPGVGDKIIEGEAFGTVESVKSVSDLYAPVSGEVVEVNDNVLDSPETVNTDPYGAAWMIVVEIADPTEVDKLLSAEQYEEFLAEQD